MIHSDVVETKAKKIFIDFDWTFCITSSKTLCLYQNALPFQTTSHLLKSGLLFLLLISAWLELYCMELVMRRNATMLIIMSLALVCLCLGDCESWFGETKPSIPIGPCVCFSVLILCPLYTVCSSDNHVPHYMLSSHWSSFSLITNHFSFHVH